MDAKLELLDGKWVQKLSANHNSTVNEDTSVSSFGTFFSENEGEDNKFSYLSSLQIDTPELLQSRHFLTGLVEFEEELFTPKIFRIMMSNRVSIPAMWRNIAGSILISYLSVVIFVMMIMIHLMTKPHGGQQVPCG